MDRVPQPASRESGNVLTVSSLYVFLCFTHMARQVFEIPPPRTEGSTAAPTLLNSLPTYTFLFIPGLRSAHDVQFYCAKVRTFRTEPPQTVRSPWKKVLAPLGKEYWPELRA